MRKYKNIIKMISVILSVLMLTGCGYTEEEKALMEQYKKQGKENAINYIEEKYGFTPSVENVECKTVDITAVPDFSPSPTGAVYVDMKYQLKEFRVYISGEETTDGYDNYQSDEIVKAIKEKVINIIGNVESVCASYGQYNVEEEHSDFGLVRTYFNGDNLTEVLESSNTNRLVVSTVGSDLTVVEQGMLPDSLGENIYCAFVDYRTSDDYNASTNKSLSLTGHPIDYSIEKEFIFIDEYFTADATNLEYHSVNVQKFGNFYYCIQDGTYCNFSETDIEPVSNWNGRGFINAKQIYQAYSIDTDARQVILWIPYNEIEDSIVEGARVSTQYVHENELSYSTSVTNKIANKMFLQASIYPGKYADVKFTIMTDLGK